ncbi:unnamed protein product [Pedinophyceae sp. YPF-701]|nr:unnamed protein product [Pedinophyceae sp. YPF-701]
MTVAGNGSEAESQTSQREGARGAVTADGQRGATGHHRVDPHKLLRKITSKREMSKREKEREKEPRQAHGRVQAPLEAALSVPSSKAEDFSAAALSEITALLQALLVYVPPSLIPRFAQATEACRAHGFGQAVALEPECKVFQGAVMVVDVTGFTRLTEKLSKNGGAGGELLIACLNDLFGKAISVVTGYRGEVIKFAGDAMVVAFAPEEGAQNNRDQGLSSAVVRAVFCAHELARRLGTVYMMPTGTVAKLRQRAERHVAIADDSVLVTAHSALPDSMMLKSMVQGLGSAQGPQTAQNSGRRASMQKSRLDLRRMSRDVPGGAGGHRQGSASIGPSLAEVPSRGTLQHAGSGIAEPRSRTSMHTQRSAYTCKSEDSRREGEQGQSLVEQPSMLSALFKRPEASADAETKSKGLFGIFRTKSNKVAQAPVLSSLANGSPNTSAHASSQGRQPNASDSGHGRSGDQQAKHSVLRLVNGARKSSYAETAARNRSGQVAPAPGSGHAQSSGVRSGDAPEARAQPSGYNKLSMKLMVGCGALCTYHVGSRYHHSGGSRWEAFLADAPGTFDVDDLGRRRAMLQVANIEGSAQAEKVVLSQEVVDCVGSILRTEECGSGGAHMLQETLLDYPAALRSFLPAGVPAAPRNIKMGAQLLSAALHDLDIAQLDGLQRTQLVNMVGGHVLPFIRERLEHNQGEFLSEVREITTLFLGFPGLTQPWPDASSALGAVQLHFKVVRDAMAKHNGDLLQIRCDEKGYLCICAFGLPGRARPTDASRAVRAAWEIRRKMKEEGFLTVAGMSRGELLCGRVGSRWRCEYTVFGNAINLSARLMCRAKKSGADQIMCCSALAEGARDTGAFQPLGEIEVKGRTEPIPIFELVGVKGTEEEDTAGVQTKAQGREGWFAPSTPLFGREGVKDRLQQLLQQHVGGTGGHTVIIEAEKGAGKTAILNFALREATEQGSICTCEERPNGKHEHCPMHKTDAIIPGEPRRSMDGREIAFLARTSVEPLSRGTLLGPWVRLLAQLFARLRCIPRLDQDRFSRWAAIHLHEQAETVGLLTSTLGIPPSQLPFALPKPHQEVPETPKNTKVKTLRVPRATRTMSRVNLHRERSAAMMMKAASTLGKNRGEPDAGLGGVPELQTLDDAPSPGGNVGVTDAAELNKQASMLRALSSMADPRSPTRAGEADTLAPVLTGMATLARPLPKSEAEETALVSLMAQILQGIAETCGSVVLVIDDAHLMDDSSWQLLQRITSLGKQGPLTILSIDPDFIAQAQLDVQYAVLKRRPDSHVVQLEPLTRQQVYELAEFLCGPNSPVLSHVDAVHARAGGHPLLTEQLVRYLHVLGRNDEAAVLRAVTGLPADLRGEDLMLSVITQRLDLLPASVQLSIKVASVVGEVFPLSVVQRVHPIRLSEEQLLADLTHLTEAGIVHPLDPALSGTAQWGVLDGTVLVPQDGSAGTMLGEGGSKCFRFSTHLSRQVAYSLIPVSQQARIHADVAHVMQESGGVPPSVVAHHLSRSLEWMSASLAERLENAVLLWEQAALLALAAGAHAETLRFLGRAEAVAALPVVPVAAPDLFRTSFGDSELSDEGGEPPVTPRRPSRHRDTRSFTSSHYARSLSRGQRSLSRSRGRRTAGEGAEEHVFKVTPARLLLWSQMAARANLGVRNIDGAEAALILGLDAAGIELEVPRLGLRGLLLCCGGGRQPVRAVYSREAAAEAMMLDKHDELRAEQQRSTLGATMQLDVMRARCKAAQLAELLVGTSELLYVAATTEMPFDGDMLQVVEAVAELVLTDLSPRGQLSESGADVAPLDGAEITERAAEVRDAAHRLLRAGKRANMRDVWRPEQDHLLTMAMDRVGQSRPDSPAELGRKATGGQDKSLLGQDVE